MLQLEGKKVALREFTKDNLFDANYFNWLRDLNVVNTINRLEYLMPIQFSEVEAYVKRLWESKNDAFFAIYAKDTNEFIGTQRLAQIDWRTGIADVGILVGNRNYWGKGIAKDAVSTAAEYAFNTLSLRRLTAGTPASNIAMIKCFERLGFKQEGRHRQQLLLSGEYVDRVLFGMFKEEFKPF